jgi:hypothetical protein
VRRLFVLLVVLALGGAASPEHSSEGLIYCGLGTGRPTYLPSFYVDPGLYGIGMGGAAGPTSISLCAVYGATAKVVLLAPHGATIALDRPAGANVGTLYAKVQVGKRSVNLPRPLASIVTADPLRYVHNACVPGRHAAVWLLRARSADDAVRLALPIYLDPVAGGAYRLQLCFGSPNGKRRIVGWPARATFRLLTLTIDQRVLGEAPTEPAAYVWHGFFTPFRADGSTHAAATVEARATQLLPVAWTLAGTYDAGIGAARIAAPREPCGGADRRRRAVRGGGADHANDVRSRLRRHRPALRALHGAIERAEGLRQRLDKRIRGSERDRRGSRSVKKRGARRPRRPHRGVTN